MTHQAQTNALAAFSTERDTRLITLPLRMPDRTRGLIARESGGLCVFCGEPGNTLARLVPYGSGGPSRMFDFWPWGDAYHRYPGWGG